MRRMIRLNGSKAKLYMQFEKMLPSAQGMDVWQDRAYILYDTGCCGVYDLATRNSKPISFFSLGSYNEGNPDKNYLNHANSCMFSQIHFEDNPIPLLYVTIGSGIGMDEDGFFYRCAVENITRTEDESGQEHFCAETIQTISYRPAPIKNDQYEQPAWGCPAFFVDSEADALYIFSARYRTTRGHVPEGKQNAYIITKFALPSVSDRGMIHLGPDDILDQFSVESDVMFTQGGTLVDDKIYYTAGCPARGYPIHIMIFDLLEKCQIAQIDHMDEAFGQEEIECCAIYKDNLLCNTCDGSIFFFDKETK